MTLDPNLKLMPILQEVLRRRAAELKGEMMRLHERKRAAKLRRNEERLRQEADEEMRRFEDALQVHSRGGCQVPVTNGLALCLDVFDRVFPTLSRHAGPPLRVL